MKVFDLTNGTVSSVSTGATVYPYNSILERPLGATGTLQITKTGTISVQLQGRMSDDDSWSVIGTYSADTAVNVALFPQMRYNATTMTTATLKMKLGVPMK